MNNKSLALLAILIIIILIAVIAIHWSNSCEPCDRKNCNSPCSNNGSSFVKRSSARCALSPETCSAKTSSTSSSSSSESPLVDDAWSKHKEFMKQCGGYKGN